MGTSVLTESRGEVEEDEAEDVERAGGTLPKCIIVFDFHPTPTHRDISPGGVVGPVKIAIGETAQHFVNATPWRHIIENVPIPKKSNRLYFS